MMHRLVPLLLLALSLLLVHPAGAAETPKVVIETNLGDIGVELLVEEAPITVENFLNYIDSNFYDYLVFHRVIEDFVIQTGGYTVYESQIYKMRTAAPIINESYNGLLNLRGTIAMARTTEPNSATSQFYINHTDNPDLDYVENDADSVGYCVFGRVISGMDVVDAIAAAPVENIGYGLTDFPVPLIWISKARIAPPGYWLDGDLNNDGLVNFCDFALFTHAYAAGDAIADIDNSTTVDPHDIAYFAQNWAQTTDWR